MILLDTCALLWLVADQNRLSEAACTELARHRERVFVSAISAFEVAIKHRKGKLRLPMSPDQWYQTAEGVLEDPRRGRLAFAVLIRPPTSITAARSPVPVKRRRLRRPEVVHTIRSS